MHARYACQAVAAVAAVATILDDAALLLKLMLPIYHMLSLATALLPSESNYFSVCL